MMRGAPPQQAALDIDAHYIAPTAGAPTAQIAHGPYQEVLQGVVADVLLTDPPYSPRTQKGQRSGGVAGGKVGGIDYGAWNEADVHALVDAFAPRTRRWFVMFGDHHTVWWALTHLEHRGWYVFPPAVWEKTDAIPRLSADGPDSEVEFIAIARPRRKLVGRERRHRNGAFRGPSAHRVEQRFIVGQKPEWLVRALLRDYAEPGDLVVDPCAGSGTSLVAALAEGLSARGSEGDEERVQIARERIARETRYLRGVS